MEKKTNTCQRCSTLLYPLSALHIRFPVSLLSSGLSSPQHIFFHFTNHFLVIILLLRSLISGSFITCPSSTFSPSLLWHFCHQQANTSIPISVRRILHQINILDRRLDSPTLPSSHSFGPYRQPFAFSTIASPEQRARRNPSSTNR